MAEVHSKIVIQVKIGDIEENHNLTGREFVFGRSTSANVTLNDPSFSRSHFKIFYDDKKFWVTDLKSSNGTNLNQNKITEGEAGLLNPGDIISVENSSTIVKVLKIEIDQNSNSAPKAEGDITDLSQHIIQMANAKVEVIISEANYKANEIIEKAKKESEHQKKEALELNNKLIEEEKAKASEELKLFIDQTREKNLKEVEDLKKSGMIEVDKLKIEKHREMLSQVESEKKIVLGVIHKEADEIKKINDKASAKAIENLKQLEDKIENKNLEMKEIEISFKKSSDQLNLEVDEKISAKRHELENLNLSFEETKSKQLKLIEDESNLKLESKKSELAKLEEEFENLKSNQLKLIEASVEIKKLDLDKKLNETEEKLFNAKNEFEGLFKQYEDKKNDQTASLELAIKNKKIAQDDLDRIKKEIEDKKNEIASCNNEVEKTRKIQEKITNDFSGVQNEFDKLSSSLVKVKTQTTEMENELAVISNEKSKLLAEINQEKAGIAKERQSLIDEKSQHSKELEKINSDKNKIHQEIVDAKKEVEDVNANIKGLRDKMGSLNQESIEFAQKKEEEKEQVKNKFLQEKSKLEEDMRKLTESEEKRLQELTRHELNQINKIKEDSLRLILDLEDSIAKELSLSTSNVFASTIGVDKFREIAPQFEKSIRTSLQAGVLKLLKNELTPADQNKGKSLSTNKSWKPFLGGFVVATIVFGVIPFSIKYVQEQNDPIKQQLELQARLAKAPVKKFIPVKVATLGTSFVNSVIYTEGYVEIVSNEKFRSEIMKNGSIYLYKQWQIEEEKSIQAFAIVFSMIDALKERSLKIDPDNEKKDIDKMNQLEKETLKKLEGVLGNEVRLEATLKFYNRFYQEFVTKK